MKELTIEEKAERYDKIIIEFKPIYDLAKEQGRIIDVEEFERIFPELKESEDERVRKALIEYFNEQCDMSDWNGVYGYQVVAWLEKQGKQKPADKVEPKFKVGDWIVDNCGYIWKIEEILNQFYLLEGIEGGESRPTIEWVNKTFHLWTIKDAKDGDVLRIRNLTFIFQKITNDNVRHKDAVVAYCSYEDNDDAFGVSGPDCITDLELIIPATEEQHDLLFQKMHDAGYEWDDKKKEPKKIEQTYTNNRFTPEQASVLDRHIDKFLEEKPAWDEDEKIRKSLINYIHCYGDAGDYTKKEFIAWVKKQGEYANFLSKIQVGDKVTRNEAGILVNISQLNRDAKPANN